MSDQYIVRAVHTDKDSGDVVHTTFFGPYPSLMSACRAGEAMVRFYRARPMNVDGAEVFTECYTETLLAPPTF